MRDRRRILQTDDRPGRDYPFTGADFRKIAMLAQAESGITVGSGKEPFIYSRLVKRLRQLDLQSFAEYVDLLSDTAQTEERSLLVSALTTNTTRFFRENHHFETLSHSVLPPLITAARKGARVRLWSAACSSGEEACCIAFAVLKLCPDAAGLDIKILATDIDLRILGVARRGTYPGLAVAALPDDITRRFFDPPEAAGAARSVTGAVRALIEYRQMNLVRPWPVRGPFDAVFCRNVAIYFDADTQNGIWRGFHAVIGRGGYLFIGHSERLSAAVKPGFAPVGMTTYRRSKAALLPASAAAGLTEGSDKCL